MYGVEGKEDEVGTERLRVRHTGQALFHRHHPFRSRNGSFRKGIEGFEV